MGFNNEKFKPITSVVDDAPEVTFDNIEYFSFDDAIDAGELKEVFSVYGQKNGGKTTVTYGIPYPGDKVLVFSFDKKSSRPISAPYIQESNLDIKVIDAVKFLDKSNEKKYLDSSIVTHKFIVSMLNQAEAKFAPDWIVFDATEDMNSIMEIVMRAHNNLRPYQGIANRSLWRERRQYLDDIHIKSMSIAKKGVIYTMYSQKDEIIKEGATEEKSDVPRWVGSIMEQTDVVIKAYVKFENGRNKFYARVEGSKLPEKYPDQLYDVTAKRFRDAITSTT